MHTSRVFVLALLVGCSPQQDFFGPSPHGDVTPGFFGPTVQRPEAPPPISGGTLIVLRDGKTAVAADPDRDLVSFVDLEGHGVRARVQLGAHDEPGRLVEDGDGRVHVALRGGQSLLTLDGNGRQLARRGVCATPRGVVWQKDGDLVHVACASGELVSLPAAGGSPVRTLELGRDLRDVVVDGDHLLVSRFKSAEILVVAPDGSTTGTLQADPLQLQSVRSNGHFSPSVAWKMVALPDGGALVLHQRGLTDLVQVIQNPPPGQSSYGNSSDKGFTPNCSEAIVHATVTRIGRQGAQLAPSPVLAGAVVAVDMALAPDGKTLAIATPGNYKTSGLPSVIRMSVSDFGGDTHDCLNPSGASLGAQITAVAWTLDGRLLAQAREPATLFLVEDSGPTTLATLSDESREDTGHAVFHNNSGTDVACASCHPEGGEDGRVWTFSNSGPRRTQSLRGGILGTEPFHWDGDMRDLNMIIDQVFVRRMGGPNLDKDQRSALSGFIDQIPLLREPVQTDAPSVARGKLLFEDKDVGCVTCHSGAAFTSNETKDVGSGGAFQIPSLRGVAFRAPFRHDGCAATLAGRFDPACRGAGHGNTAQLTKAQLGDLVTYLETL